MNGRTNVTTGTNTDDIVVPLDPITNFSVIPGNGFVSVQWTDPKDKYATPEGEIAQDPQQLVSEFDYTIVVRKIGSAPVDFKDGEVSVLSSVRNQYAESAYVDKSVTYDETYYYAAWVFNKDGIESDRVFAEPVTPKYYDSVLANNTWERINEACTNGIGNSLWEIGDEKTFTAIDQTLTAVIIDFNHDDLTDGSGKAVISFAIKEYVPGKGVGGHDAYDYVDMNGRSYLINTVQPTINQDLLNQIIQVTKTNQYHGVTFEGIRTGTPTNDKIYMFGINEVIRNAISSVIKFTDGYQYPYFATQSNRARQLPWWTRAGYRDYGVSSGYCVSANGGYIVGPETVIGDDPKHCNVFGFCIGKSAT